MFTRIVNQLGYRSSAQFETFFLQEDLTLEILLEDDNVVNEFRNKNEKLQKFFTQERMIGLIKYITVMPPLDTDEKKANKYSFQACEILSQEQQFIWDQFFPPLQEYNNNGDVQPYKKDNVLLDHLFDFLNTSGEINDVLSGYWGQVITCIHSKKARSLLEYLYANPQICKNMMNQIQSRSVADILLKMIAIESCTYLPEKNSIMPLRQKLLSDMIQFVVIKDLNKDKFEALDNIANIFFEILKDYKTIWEGETLINYIIQPERARFLLERTMSFDKNVSLCSSSILSSITSAVIKAKHEESNIDQNCLLELFVEQFDMLIDFLQIDCQPAKKFQNGQQIKPFGQNKLKLLETLTYLLKAQDQEFFKKFAQQKTLQKMIKMLQKYPWNNIMHNLVMKIFKTLFTQGEKFEIEIPQHELIEELLLATSVTQEGKYRKGFLGSVTEIGQSFEKYLGTTNEDFRFDKPDVWVKFEEQYYFEAKKQIRKQLGLFGSKKNSIDFAGFKLIDVQNLQQSEPNEEDKHSESSSSSEEPPIKEEEIEYLTHTIVTIEQSIEEQKEEPKKELIPEEEKELKEEDFDDDESVVRSRRR